MGSLHPGAYKDLFEPSEHLWWVWGLFLDAVSPLLPSYWNFSFALGHGVSFFGGIQYSPVDGCSAASCNFGVLVGEDEQMSFYSAICSNVGRSANSRTQTGRTLHTERKGTSAEQ